MTIKTRSKLYATFIYFNQRREKLRGNHAKEGYHYK